MADKVLIVDDEETIREIVSSMLTAAQYTCEQCSSGDAVRLLESRGSFQLVLYDLTMKDVDGFIFIESIRNFPIYPSSSWLAFVTSVPPLRPFALKPTTTC
jgi:CheY-like chemotaxis protein